MLVELSTLKIALPASLTYASLFADPVAWSTKVTFPRLNTLGDCAGSKKALTISSIVVIA